MNILFLIVTIFFMGCCTASEKISNCYTSQNAFCKYCRNKVDISDYNSIKGHDHNCILEKFPNLYLLAVSAEVTAEQEAEEAQKNLLIRANAAVTKQDQKIPFRVFPYNIATKQLRKRTIMYSIQKPVLAITEKFPILKPPNRTEYVFGQGSYSLLEKKKK